MSDLRPIALFIPALNGGGAQKVVVNLSNALVDLTNKPIHVVLVRREGVFLKELRPEVTVVDLGSNRVSRSVFALARYMRRSRPSVIVSSLNYANIACLIAGILARHPSRIIIREDNVVRQPSGSVIQQIRRHLFIQLMRWLYPRADAVVAISEAVRETMLDARIRIEHNSTVIGNPITIAQENQKSLSPESVGVPKGTRFICAIGRLTEQKGFDILLSAFAKLREPCLHLVILGEGELRDALSSLAKDLGVEQRVHMPGFVNSPMAILREAEAFVLSSRWEGFGNVLVEALASGVPIISTDCAGAPRWILENGRHGCLVSPDDSSALAEAIEKSLHSPVGTKAGRIRRANDFSAERITKEYLTTVLN